MSMEGDASQSGCIRSGSLKSKVLKFRMRRCRREPDDNPSRVSVSSLSSDPDGEPGAGPLVLMLEVLPVNEDEDGVDAKEVWLLPALAPPPAAAPEDRGSMGCFSGRILSTVLSP
jgi:hypothetical protein